VACRPFPTEKGRLQATAGVVVHPPPHCTP
jgi:hypothetical protein